MVLLDSYRGCNYSMYPLGFISLRESESVCRSLKGVFVLGGMCLILYNNYINRALFIVFFFKILFAFKKVELIKIQKGRAVNKSQ